MTALLIGRKLIHKVGLFMSLLSLITSSSFTQIDLRFTDLVTSGLNSPVDIANDGGTRLFIVEQTGAIRIYSGGMLLATPFINLSSRISCCGERGLLSLVFHPQYATNGLFYVYYTAAVTGAITVERFKTDPTSSNIADPATGKVLISIPHPTNTNHNGGHLAFGPDGYLYFATGDGGGGGDPDDNAQDLNSLLGKMIRINVTTDDVAPYYTIPPDNPYLGTPTRELIWAFGFRNPFRWSFDRANGNMWIADVGQNLWEEVNRVNAVSPGGSTPANLNFGWDCFEGTHAYADPSPRLPCPGPFVTPVAEYNHSFSDGGFSVTGGYVYRGSLYSDLFGHYIFADYVSGNVWLLPPGGTAADTILYRGLKSSITSFGENATGELFATTLTGGLSQVVTAFNITPVNLISFQGLPTNDFVDLTWEIKNEVDVQQYEVETSFNGTDFSRVGIVKAEGKSIYQFKHTLQSDRSTYYRLKILDIDGKFQYSKIIQVTPASLRDNNFVKPSIITNRVLNIYLAGSFNQVQLISMEGKEIWRQNISGRTGNIQQQLPTLIPGTYLVRLVSKDKILSQKITIR